MLFRSLGAAMRLGRTMGALAPLLLKARAGLAQRPSANDRKWSGPGGEAVCFLLGTLKMLKGLLPQSPGGPATQALGEGRGDPVLKSEDSWGGAGTHPPPQLVTAEF